MRLPRSAPEAYRSSVALIEDVERVAHRSNEARLRRSAAAGVVLHTLAGVACGLLAGEVFLRFAHQSSLDDSSSNKVSNELQFR